MKKIFILLISLILVCGCNFNTPTPIKVNDEPTIGLFTSIEKFTFEDHDYIWFKAYNGTLGYSGGIVHDPNCKCMIDYD